MPSNDMMTVGLMMGAVWGILILLFSGRKGK